MAYGPPPPGALPTPTIPTSPPSGAAPAPFANNPGSAYGQECCCLETAQAILAVVIDSNATLLRIEELILKGAGKKPGSGDEDQEQKQRKKGIDLLGILSKLIQGASAGGVAMAHNSGVGMTVAAANTAASILPGLAGKLAGVFGTLVTATASLVNAFVERGRELAKYSATISVAQARSDVKLMMSDIRESQVLGDNYARLIEAQTDVQIAIREAILPIKEVVIDNLADILQGISAFLNSDFGRGLFKGLSAGANVSSSIFKFLTLDFTGSFKDLKKAAKNIEEIADNTKKPVAEPRNLMGELLEKVPVRLMPFQNEIPANNPLVWGNIPIVEQVRGG